MQLRHPILCIISSTIETDYLKFVKHDFEVSHFAMFVIVGL